MKRRPSNRAHRRKLIALTLLAGVGALAAGLPAFGQQAPESLLPPGFGDPVPPPAPNQPEAPQPAPIDPGAPPAGAAAGGIPTLAPAPPTPEELAALEEKEKEEAEEYELPDEARRPIEIVGPLRPENGGLAFTAWGTADGRYLSTLMRRVDAPIASRWASILLRRALLSEVPTPRAIAAADWVADRAWLLLRRGEADAARSLVQRIDTDRYTPRLYAVAAQVALATGDPAAFCPLVAGASSEEPSWVMAGAICSGLAGDAATAGAIIDRVRDRNIARGADVLLAEKVVGAGTGGRRAINIEWEGVNQLTSWRFGMASATGVAIPDQLFGTVGPHVRAWQARNALYPLETRIAAARIGAAIGVFSSASLVDLYSLQADAIDPAELSTTPAGRLGAAFAGDSTAVRIDAIRTLWDQPANAREDYAAHILTARAAARLQPSADLSAEAGGLIGSMLSAGIDRRAARWAGVVNAMGGAESDQPWALLAVGAPGNAVAASIGRFDEYADRAGTEGAHRARLLLAALAGLGKVDAATAQQSAQRLGMVLTVDNRWSQALELAVSRNQPGTVALLAAAGMQTGDWRGVPPQHLYLILSALRRTGQEAIARMIAAEAVMRA